MKNDGYSIVRVTDGVEIEHFTSNVAPPDVVMIAEALIAVHCPQLGWQADRLDGEGEVLVTYRLVRRVLDEEGEETRTQKLGEPQLAIDGNTLTVACALVDRSEAEVAAWDTAQLAADMALTCTRSQFMLAALELGKLDAIEGFIAGLDPADIDQREIIIRFREASTFYRNFFGWNQMAPLIGESAASVTALFRLALTK